MLECVDKKDNCFFESKNQNMLRVLNVTQGKMCGNKCTNPQREYIIVRLHTTGRVISYYLKEVKNVS